MWTSLRIYIYKIVDFINGLSGLLYRTGWTSVNGILNHRLKKVYHKKSAEVVVCRDIYTKGPNVYMAQQIAYDRKCISTFVYRLWSFQLSRARDETVRILDSIQNGTGSSACWSR